MAVVAKRTQLTWTRFSPTTQLPFGGFGDPGLAEPLWRQTADADNDKFDLARAQHRLAVDLRLHIRRIGMTEADLENQLGYKRGYLVRKLNGVEAMTMRDVVRIARVFGPPMISALATDLHQGSQGSQGSQEFSRQRTKG